MYILRIYSFFIVTPVWRLPTDIPIHFPHNVALAEQKLRYIDVDNGYEKNN